MRNIAVIGCGMVSGYGHLPAIHASDDWNLAAISDVRDEALAAVREKHGEVPAFTEKGKSFPHAYEMFARSIERGELVELASGLDGLRATEAAFRALESAERA